MTGTRFSSWLLKIYFHFSILQHIKKVALRDCAVSAEVLCEVSGCQSRVFGIRNAFLCLSCPTILVVNSCQSFCNMIFKMFNDNLSHSSSFAAGLLLLTYAPLFFLHCSCAMIYHRLTSSTRKRRSTLLLICGALFQKPDPAASTTRQADETTDLKSGKMRWFSFFDGWSWLVDELARDCPKCEVLPGLGGSTTGSVGI
jgi:hypothetical protein